MARGDALECCRSQTESRAKRENRMSTGSVEHSLSAYSRRRGNRVVLPALTLLVLVLADAPSLLSRYRSFASTLRLQPLINALNSLPHRYSESRLSMDVAHKPVWRASPGTGTARDTDGTAKLLAAATGIA